MGASEFDTSYPKGKTGWQRGDERGGSNGLENEHDSEIARESERDRERERESTQHGHSDPYAALEAGEPVLLASTSLSASHSHSHSPYSSPYSRPASLADTSSGRKPEAIMRLAKAAKSVPGVSRVLQFANWVLGPVERTQPPLPTARSFTFPLKSKDASSPPRYVALLPTPVDSYATGITRRLRLDCLWLPFLLVWLTGFVLLIRQNFYNPASPPIIDCTAAMWPDWPPDTCGVNGSACAWSLESGSTYRCPSGCRDVPLGNPRWIGGEEVNGRPLVVGGGDEEKIYRADSWVCAAGVHAGLVSPTYGGCVSITSLPYPAGSSNFIGSKSAGLISAPFAPFFPGAFTLSANGTTTQCMDWHWPITAYNVICLFVFTALFAPPPVVLFTVLLLVGYLHITLVSDAPSLPPYWSGILGGVPPVLFAGYWAWHVSFARTLKGFAAAKLPLEVAVWQGFGYWVGMESSTLFSHIPISRLGYGALPPGGIVALVIIIALVTVIVVIQAYQMRKLGLLRFYLARYLPLVPILIILANLGSGMYLRLHHYLIALAGIPVTSLPNRISLFGQAFCLAFFLDGVGRWGWDSIVQSGSELLGDAAFGSILPNITVSSSDVLSWPAPNATLVAAGISQFAIMLDDIAVQGNLSVTNFTLSNWTSDLGIDHYFRIAYMANGTSMDFTDPLTWYASNRTWEVPVPDDHHLLSNGTEGGI